MNPGRRLGVRGKDCSSAGDEIAVDTVDVADAAADIGVGSDAGGAESRADESADLDVEVYQKHLDPWVEGYSCDEDPEHESCCCVSAAVHGETAQEQEQLYGAGVRSERSLVDDPLVYC